MHRGLAAPRGWRSWPVNQLRAHSKNLGPEDLEITQVLSHALSIVPMRLDDTFD
jgi:hypothetical protein